MVSRPIISLVYSQILKVIIYKVLTTSTFKVSDVSNVIYDKTRIHLLQYRTSVYLRKCAIFLVFNFRIHAAIATQIQGFANLAKNTHKEMLLHQKT